MKPLTPEQLQSIRLAADLERRRWADYGMSNSVVDSTLQALDDREALIAALRAYEAAYDACGAGSGQCLDDMQEALYRRFEELKRAALARVGP